MVKGKRRGEANATEKPSGEVRRQDPHQARRARKQAIWKQTDLRRASRGTIAGKQTRRIAMQHGLRFAASELREDECAKDIQEV